MHLLPPAAEDVGVAPLQAHHCGALLRKLAQQFMDLQQQQVLKVLMATTPAKWCLTIAAAGDVTKAMLPSLEGDDLKQSPHLPAGVA